MITYRNVISHRWARAQTMRQLEAGHISAEGLCDADFLLVTAATYHGREVDRSCPVCARENLREVRWIYGDTLGSRSGTARSEEEIAAIVEELAGQRVPRGKDGEVAVHLVEVCPACRWNHLLTTGVAELA
ncbi:DUF5318 family protein [Corynebacterium doosanense]|uniref:DUF5318 domain-containing protein n=1 Tax=Corynebacterium doosanense CAU 212 = DSM 45436 TaxID=558173 RepID=A0A097IIY2_9CORY|nr:DUF5318 family protein [Corynebacterium doosanense]AIT62068.1 hypothetical protein CDOO_12955 [Corynebacterium doosanense CAU 212 = DSM 45436]